MAHRAWFTTAAKPLMRSSFPEGHTKSQEKAATEHELEPMSPHISYPRHWWQWEARQKVLVCQAADNKATSTATFPTGSSKRVSTSFWVPMGQPAHWQSPLQLHMLQVVPGSLLQHARWSLGPCVWHKVRLTNKRDRISSHHSIHRQIEFIFQASNKERKKTQIS